MTIEQRVAKIEENDGAWELTWEVTVYERGRLIHVMKKDGGHCATEQEAHDALAQFYPDVPIVGEQEFRQFYTGQGYIYPPSYNRETDLICHQCPDTTLVLQQRSIGAGRNTPYGNPWHMWYDCPKCHRVYCDQRQEFTDGIHSAWAYEEPGTTQFIDCEAPRHLPVSNPYGFRETLLVARKHVMK